MPGLFITGTDTGVGKTYVTTLLAKYFQKQGIKVAIFKPIATGPKSENDALYYRKQLKLKEPLTLINPIHLSFPLAPYPAAKLEKKKINLKKIFKTYKILESKSDLVLVEGIGGVLVPITKNYLVADLIEDLNLPSVIVARAGLGTINHTLLTIEVLKAHKIKIIGVIMNGFGKKSDISEKTNAEIIEELSHVPILAKVKKNASDLQLR